MQDKWTICFKDCFLLGKIFSIRCKSYNTRYIL